MPVRFLLNFSTPFQVGDAVFLAYPPNNRAVGGPATGVNPIRATVSAIRISFGSAEELTLDEPADSYEVSVKEVVYTLVPSSAHQSSPFLVTSPTTDRAVLFATEEAFYQQEASESAPR